LPIPDPIATPLIKALNSSIAFCIARQYPNITVNASYTPYLLPTLAPSTADTMTAQPTTNLETPTTSSSNNHMGNVYHDFG
jgi:hypothetical protein